MTVLPHPAPCILRIAYPRPPAEIWASCSSMACTKSPVSSMNSLVWVARALISASMACAQGQQVQCAGFRNGCCTQGTGQHQGKLGIRQGGRALQVYSPLHSVQGQAEEDQWADMPAWSSWDANFTHL